MVLERAQLFERLRYTHSAWRLLASRRAPVVLACFEFLFQERPDVSFEDGVQHLEDLFMDFKNVEDFAIKGDDVRAEARKEVREWIKKKLIVERDGRLSPTDALQRATEFVQSLDTQLMTSTASRLLTVQSIIERLEMQLNPEKESRVSFLKKKIQELERELEKAERGEIEILDEHTATEEVKEIFQQGMSLKADFRRVEDSYRKADYELRKKITRANQGRGEVLDSLLDSHDALLETPEGNVFNAFYEQLQERTKLEQMKQRLRSILTLPVAAKALNGKQSLDLRDLVYTLLSDSSRVIDARIRGEQDVKSYVKTGLASENFRIGALINELTEAATEIDWGNRKISHLPAHLPPVSLPVTNLPLVQRLLPKSPSKVEGERLNLDEQETDGIQLDEGFWASFRSLDREELFQNTLDFLKAQTEEVPLSALREVVDAEHDLESVAYLLSLAREAELPFSEERESFTITGEEQSVEFNIPKVMVSAETMAEINRENLD